MTAPTPEAPETPAPPSTWQLSACLQILDHIQEQIRYADSKAGFIAAFNVLLFGFVANHMDKVRILSNGGKSPSTPVLALAIALVVIYAASMVTTFVMVVACVVSRFGEKANQSRVFFAHIAAQYGKDHARYVEEIGRMSAANWVAELGTQVVEVSRLALLKHRYVRRAACFTLLSVVLWIGSLATLIAISWR